MILMDIGMAIWPDEGLMVMTMLLIIQAVPWLRRLVAGLSPWRPGFSLRPVYVGFVGTQWHWYRFFSKNFSFSLSVSFHQCSALIHLPLRICGDAVALVQIFLQELQYFPVSIIPPMLHIDSSTTDMI